MIRRFDENPSEEMRAVQIWQVLIAQATTRRTLTYGILADILGFKGAGVFARLLGHIMYYCRENKLPPLTVLVVNQDTGLPGDGLTKVDVDVDRESVFKFPWFHVVPPSAEELHAAYVRGMRS